MPQLVKGAKNVFGWSRVGDDGRIIIPPDAFAEYGFVDKGNAIVMSGSRKSGGFGLTRLDKIKESSLAGIITVIPELKEYKISEGAAVRYSSRLYCWVRIFNESITVPLETLKQYGINKGDMLLTARGSNLALGFIVKGPIVAEAKKHSDLKVYR